MTHSFASDIGLWQLQVLREEGVDPSRVIIKHADSYRLRSYHEALLVDGRQHRVRHVDVVPPNTVRRCPGPWCASTSRAGFRDQVLVSMDTCKSEHLARFGGPGLSGNSRRRCCRDCANEV